MVLLASLWEMKEAGRWVVPSEGPAALEPACSEWRLEAGTAELWLVPGGVASSKGGMP